MNQIKKQEILHQKQKQRVEKNEYYISVMDDKEIVKLASNFVDPAKKFYNDPFVIGTLNHDNTMTMQDIKLTSEIKSSGMVIDIDFLNSGETKSYNQHSLPSILNKFLVRRFKESDGFYLPKDQRQLVQEFNIEGKLSHNNQVNFSLDILDKKVDKNSVENIEQFTQVFGESRTKAIFDIILKAYNDKNYNAKNVGLVILDKKSNEDTNLPEGSYSENFYGDIVVDNVVYNFDFDLSTNDVMNFEPNFDDIQFNSMNANLKETSQLYKSNKPRIKNKI